MFTSSDFDLKMTFDVKSLVKGKTQQANQPQEKKPLLLFQPNFLRGSPSGIKISSIRSQRKHILGTHTVNHLGEPVFTAS